MPDITFRGGRLPNDPSKPRLYFQMFWNKDFTPPASVDYYGMPYIGMMGNNEWGDCVFASIGHTTEEQTYYGQGTEYEVSDAAALAAYSAVTGFNPNAGPPGDNPTDNGATVQQGLQYLQTTGFGGNTIAAYAQITASNLTQAQTAVSEFGVVTIGMDVYQSMMTQFNAGQPWDVTNDPGQLLGGHCVDVVGYDATYIYVFTWGAVQKATWAWWNWLVAANGGEAWASIGTDWVNAATGLDPAGVNKYAFGAQYAALTGKPNPFPAPADTVTVSNPGAQSSTVSTAITALTATAASSAGSAFTSFTASGLPAGLTATSTGGTLTVSGTPATAQTATVTLTATDALGTSGTASFTWTVAAVTPTPPTPPSPPSPPDSYDTVLATSLHGYLNLPGAMQAWLTAKGL